ncbi:CSK [Branchiostoma lanceolatum]|uniref:CSK protein n=1 Tax=Branchiostoma lanceolatum TaxID=7740 RepID=A0A8J9ZAJ3_BRALA|nr:CSK [Branchiostoma lanceolatum]
MDPQHRNLLTQFRVELVNGIVNVSAVVDQLVKEKILLAEEEDDIRTRRLQTDRIRTLLTILPTKGNRAFLAFCKALDNTGNTHLSNLLMNQRPTGIARYFDIVVENACHEWKEISRRLGLHEPQIASIDQTYRGRPRDCCIRALNVWLGDHGRLATVDMLKEALISARLMNVAELIESAQVAQGDSRPATAPAHARRPPPAAPVHHPRSRATPYQRPASVVHKDPLYTIKENVGMAWKDLARQLGFKEVDIEVIEDKHRDKRECCMEVLTTWRQKHGYDATVGRLWTALQAADLGGIDGEDGSGQFEETAEFFGIIMSRAGPKWHLLAELLGVPPQKIAWIQRKHTEDKGRCELALNMWYWDRKSDSSIDSLKAAVFNAGMKNAVDAFERGRGGGTEDANQDVAQEDLDPSSSARFPMQEVRKDHTGTEPMDSSTSHFPIDEVGTDHAHGESLQHDHTNPKTSRNPAQEAEHSNDIEDEEAMDCSTNRINSQIDNIIYERQSQQPAGGNRLESQRSDATDAMPVDQSQRERLHGSQINPYAEAPSNLLYESGAGSGASIERRLHRSGIGSTARGIEIDRKEFTIEKDEYGDNRRLGRGSFGTVYLAKWQGTHVAVKEFDDEDQTHESFRREMEHLRELRHPHIVQLLGICWQPNIRRYLLMTYVDGVDLGTILFRPSRSPVKVPNTMPVKGKIATDLCSAVSYLHDKHDLVHQDIKPGNVLIAEKTLHTYLCDLGVAKLKTAAISSTLTRTQRSAPTPIKYLPPECDDGLTVGKSSDIWCLGCTLAELFSGVELWDLHGVCHVHYERVLRKKREERLPPDALLAIRDDVFPGVRELLEKALCYDYKKRVSAAKMSEEFAAMCENALQ